MTTTTHDDPVGNDNEYGGDNKHGVLRKGKMLYGNGNDSGDHEGSGDSSSGNGYSDDDIIENNNGQEVVRWWNRQWWKLWGSNNNSGGESSTPYPSPSPSYSPSSSSSTQKHNRWNEMSNNNYYILSPLSALQYSEVLMLSLALWMAYLLLPRGLRRHYFGSYPRRYVLRKRRRRCTTTTPEVSVVGRVVKGSNYDSYGGWGDDQSTNKEGGVFSVASKLSSYALDTHGSTTKVDDDDDGGGTEKGGHEWATLARRRLLKKNDNDFGDNNNNNNKNDFDKLANDVSYGNASNGSFFDQFGKWQSIQQQQEQQQQQQQHEPWDPWLSPDLPPPPPPPPPPPLPSTKTSNPNSPHPPQPSLSSPSNYFSPMVDPSPIHPDSHITNNTDGPTSNNNNEQHVPPSEQVVSSALSTLRSSRGLRLRAHGTSCASRKIRLRLDTTIMGKERLIWRTETTTSTISDYEPNNHNENVNNNDNYDDDIEKMSTVTTGSSGTLESKKLVLGTPHPIPLNDILYVDVGKKTAALGSGNGVGFTNAISTTTSINNNDDDNVMKIPSKRCFSILTVNGSLDLDCSTKLERDAIVSCLCIVLDSVGNAKVIEEQKQKRQWQRQQRKGGIAVSGEEEGMLGMNGDNNGSSRPWQQQGGWRELYRTVHLANNNSESGEEENDNGNAVLGIDSSSSENNPRSNKNDSTGTDTNSLSPSGVITDAIDDSGNHEGINYARSDTTSDIFSNLDDEF